MLQTYILFIDETDRIDSIPRDGYAALVRRTTAAPRYANQLVRVADFYVRCAPSSAEVEIANETYTTLAFDPGGVVDKINAQPPLPCPTRTSTNTSTDPRSPGDRPAYPVPPTGSTWVPTVAERERLLAYLMHRHDGDMSGAPRT